MDNETKKLLIEELKDRKEELLDKISDIKTFCKEQLECHFNDFLDSCYPTIEIADREFRPSKVLAKLDSVAYEMDFESWLDDLTHNDLKKIDIFSELIEKLEKTVSLLITLEKE